MTKRQLEIIEELLGLYKEAQTACIEEFGESVEEDGK